MLTRQAWNLIGAVFLGATLVGTTSYVAWAARTPVDVTTSCWDTVGKGKSKVQGAGGAKGPAWVEFYFGPDIDLAANEFLAFIDDGQVEVVLFGTYVVIDQKKLELTPDCVNFADSLEDVFRAIIDELFGGVLGEYTLVVRVLDCSAKAKAKFSNKRGEELKFSSKTKMELTLTAQGQTVIAGAKLKVKTSGPRCAF